MGETARFYSRIVAAGSHQRSLRLVAEGEVGAFAIDSQVLAVELRKYPELARRLRVIESLGPSPIQPVVAARRLPRSLKSELRKALTGMHHHGASHRALAYGFVKRWEPVIDIHYDPIRRTPEVIEQAALMQVKPPV